MWSQSQPPAHLAMQQGTELGGRREARPPRTPAGQSALPEHLTTLKDASRHRVDSIPPGSLGLGPGQPTPSSEALGMLWVAVLGPPAGPWGGPGLPPSLPSCPTPTAPHRALTCGRPRLRSGHTGCAGCSARRETGGWRHRWWLPGGSHQPPLEERGGVSVEPPPGGLVPPHPGSTLRTWGSSLYCLHFSKAALCRPQAHLHLPLTCP